MVFQARHNIVQFYVFSPCSCFSSKYIFSSNPTGLLIFSRAYAFLWCLCLTCSLCFHCYPQTCPSITFPYIVKELFKLPSTLGNYFALFNYIWTSTRLNSLAFYLSICFGTEGKWCRLHQVREVNDSRYILEIQYIELYAGLNVGANEKELSRITDFSDWRDSWLLRWGIFGKDRIWGLNQSFILDTVK